MERRGTETSWLQLVKSFQVRFGDQLIGTQHGNAEVTSELVYIESRIGPDSNFTAKACCKTLSLGLETTSHEDLSCSSSNFSCIRRRRSARRSLASGKKRP